MSLRSAVDLPAISEALSLPELQGVNTATGFTLQQSRAAVTAVTKLTTKIAENDGQQNVQSDPPSENAEQMINKQIILA